VNLAHYDVTFMGAATGLAATSKTEAAARVWVWLSHGHGPMIPPCYKPVLKPDGTPTYGRLRRNTTYRQGKAFDVTLGLPDRRQRP
jgi:hypothetical protein